jgi:hypothetical protein
MTKRKDEMRRVILDIVTGREKTNYEVYELGGLRSAVAEVLYRRTSKPREDHPAYPRDPQLDEDEDKLLVQEIFWDLILEKIITPGWDVPNWKLPYFRLHSEAEQRLKKSRS